MVPAPPELTDSELATRVVSGPDAVGAFDELYARHAGRLLAYLRARFPAHADDLAQEAWTRVLDRLRSGEVAEMTNFRGWLFRIATNKGTDQYRLKRLEALGEDDNTPDPKRSLPLDALLDTERREVFRRCLEKLEPDYRAVIVASSAGEKPVEIAARLRITREAVDQRKSRGLSALRACVERHLPADSQ
jgi:RNA polymerase sigma factor (sigma-70 family)